MSKETKFTKGEWVVFMPNDDWDFNDSDDEIVIGMGDFLEDPSCHMTINKIKIEGFDANCNNADEALANAHLIKTAPKLYALLDKIQQGSQSYIENGEMYDDIEKLLAEARGE